ncbi:response regulator transcription factor [Microbacterium indicum]|uniref:response regulator transcription factor n=1 Tax=Microbacterium indicum TaxID=358100 RepID=UPI0005647399|nr:response regulator transcription factor [Microbacterium indicum]
MERVSVVIVDDEELFRFAIRTAIAREPRLQLVGEAADGEDAVRACELTHPDVVLMDINLPTIQGVEATRRICTSAPETAVLALTTLSTDRHAMAMLDAGARGLLVKDTAPADLVRAIITVAEGRSVLSESVMSEDLNAFIEQGSERARLPHLSDTERAVLQSVASGRSIEQAAGDLHFATSTVRNTLSSVNRKLGTRDRLEAVLEAARLGIIVLS